MTTHYIPMFTTRIRGGQQAACGEYVNQDEHSTEPTCATCKGYLEGVENPMDPEALFGTPDPSLVVKPVPDVDVLGDYHRQMRRFEK